jgi:hypothetical protein
MNMRQICTRLLLCMLVGTPAVVVKNVHAQTTQTGSAAAFSEAMGYYKLGKWAFAYGRFVALANRDHADAARIALFMYRFGPSLYSAEWDASTEQIEHWLQLASPQAAVKREGVNE